MRDTTCVMCECCEAEAGQVCELCRVRCSDPELDDDANWLLQVYLHACAEHRHERLGKAVGE